MKIECCFVVALVTIHIRLALAKAHDEVMKEQWLEDPQRDEAERDLQARIIDGDRVPIDTYPWFAFPFFDVSQLDVDDEILLNDDGLLRGGCAASLVAPDMLLTAAHCVDEIYAFTVLLGGFIVGQYCLDNVATNCGQNSEFHYIDTIFPHPNYSLDNGLIANDFAIIKLKDKSMIDPVPLDQNVFSPDYDEGKTLWAAGFGNTDNSTNELTAPSYLLHAEVNYVDPKTCTDIYKEDNPLFGILGINFEDEPSVMCAGNPGKGICQGDSGGPLYDKENNVLVGVTSFSSLQCSELPSGFSNVASQWPWIQETICNNHGVNNTPDFCETFSPKECDKGETLLSIQIETKSLGNDCWWGLYNHDKDEIVAEGGLDYLSTSTYQHDYCIEEGVCTIMYLEADSGRSDSIFEVTMKNETTKGKFAPEMEKIILHASASCTLDIPVPDVFSGAWNFGSDFSLQLILGSFVSLLMIL